MLPLGSFLALPFAGWAVAHYGSRVMTFLSTLCYALLLAGLGFSHSVVSMSVLLFFFGFWGDVLNIAVNVQALQVQETFYTGRSLMSSFHGMWSLGALSGAFSGGLFMKGEASLQNHFGLVTMALCLLAIIFLFFLVRKDKPREEKQPLFAWPEKSLMLLGAICFCCALCEGAMADWSSLYYKQVLNDVKRVSTTGYTSFTLLMAIGRLVGDRIADRMGYRGILLFDSILISLGLSVALFIATPISVIVGFGLVGFGVATIIPIVYSLASKSGKMAQSAALAAVSTVGFTGFLLGPPAIGFIAHQTGLRWALLLVLGLGIGIGLLAGKVTGR